MGKKNLSNNLSLNCRFAEKLEKGVGRCAKEYFPLYDIIIANIIGTARATTPLLFLLF